VFRSARRIRPLATTFVLGLLGALLFVFLGLPLPWLLGSIFALLVASRFPLPLARPRGLLLNVARLLLGVAIGTAFSPAILAQLGGYLVSLAFVVPYLVVVALCAWLYYTRLVGFDRQTAFFCALPGGLSELTLLGEEMGADARRLLLTHSTRVLILVYSLPFLIQLLSGVELAARVRIGTPLETIPPLELLTMAAAGGLGWLVARRLGVSGAAIVGPMILTAAAALGGLITHRPPDEAMRLAQLILGSAIGAAFVGLTLREMVWTVFTTLGLMAILALATTAFVILVHALTAIPVVPVILAYAPGGQAEMNLIALSIGVDVPYVALHHLVRMAIIVAIIPTIYRLLRARLGEKGSR
jgi:membrane AbrB-like protein